MTNKKVRPLNSSTPTYIRLTKEQLKEIDSAVGRGDYLNRSELIRAAVTGLLNRGRRAN